MVQTTMQQCEGELSAARGAIERARAELVELAGRSAAPALVRGKQRELAVLRETAELIEARLEGLRARAAAEAQAAERERDLAAAERLAGWRAALLEASADADRAMGELVEALERRASCAREVMQISPVELRDVSRILMPVWCARALLAAGLGAHLPLTHPWFDKRHHGALADLDRLPEVEQVLRRLRGEVGREAEAA